MYLPNKLGDNERFLIVRELRSLAEAVSRKTYGVIRDRDAFMLTKDIAVSNVKLKLENGTSVNLTIYMK